MKTFLLLFCLLFSDNSFTLSPFNEPLLVSGSSFEVKSNWINPKSIPETRRWTFPKKGIYKHLLEDHGITKEEVNNYSISEMIKLHNYLHNNSGKKP